MGKAAWELVVTELCSIRAGLQNFADKVFQYVVLQLNQTLILMGCQGVIMRQFDVTLPDQNARAGTYWLVGV